VTNCHELNAGSSPRVWGTSCLAPAAPRRPSGVYPDDDRGSCPARAPACHASCSSALPLRYSVHPHVVYSKGLTRMFLKQSHLKGFQRGIATAASPGENRGRHPRNDSFSYQCTRSENMIFSHLLRDYMLFHRLPDDGFYLIRGRFSGVAQVYLAVLAAK